MADLSLRLLFLPPLPAVQAVVGVAVAAVLDGVQQIKVKIIHSAPLQLFVEDAVAVRLFLHAPGRQLCRQRETLAGMTLHQRILYDLFRISPMIDISSIKVGKARIQIGVHHSADLIQVDHAVLFRQAHQAETKLRHFIQINTHS